VKAGLQRTIKLATLLAASILLGCSHPATKTFGRSWNPRTAASYLDYRENWWAGWMPATLDHGTFCVSCHTAMPYALARPTLRTALAEPGPSADEQMLVENVKKRVRMWKEVGPYYPDQAYGG